MEIYKLTYDNGDTTISRANGTREEIASYFYGKIFNIGTVNDSLHKVTKIEFLGTV